MAGGRGTKGRFPCLLLRLLRAGYRLLSILKPARQHAPHLEAELCYVWAAARTRLLLLARPRTPTHVTKLHSQAPPPPPPPLVTGQAGGGGMVGL
ncbi:hypothetical protein Pmani_016296 [Petrolisthes manimaculis]|uniref:Uncharacterized protein n=1 Tax=Petrolisthes manimaculis TaxID=1843537 RepID=A0AAE1PPQ7_9EUCA|nr:hypothetical protein Pmani_016296 [Petrolisthes manimaculis]